MKGRQCLDRALATITNIILCTVNSFINFFRYPNIMKVLLVTILKSTENKKTFMHCKGKCHCDDERGCACFTVTGWWLVILVFAYTSFTKTS